VRATRQGEERRIGDVASQDEIGELAREFDAMLQLLRERNREIQEAADSLEQKVELRTAELKRKNDDLQRTIELLREARHRLVMAEKLAALGELTAGMAHEINNPMTVILGNLDLLVEELGAAAEPARREIDLIVEQVYRVKEIIDNLLQYARPTRDPGELEVIDVAEVLKDTLTLVQHLTHRSDIALRLESKATRLVRIHRQELQQVLVNLLVNAVHALGGRDGIIHLQSRDWDEKGVVISIRDTGPGIPPEQLERVFAPFYSTKATGKGTGLGLSISYDLVRRYGGTITVQSPSGQGAEFRVWLLCEPELSDEDTTIAEQLRSMGSG
jgi:two-component system NtrC family sensor kinase